MAYKWPALNAGWIRALLSKHLHTVSPGVLGFSQQGRWALSGSIPGVSIPGQLRATYRLALLLLLYSIGHSSPRGKAMEEETLSCHGGVERSCCRRGLWGIQGPELVISVKYNSNNTWSTFLLLPTHVRPEDLSLQCLTSYLPQFPLTPLILTLISL